MLDGRQKGNEWKRNEFQSQHLLFIRCVSIRCHEQAAVLQKTVAWRVARFIEFELSGIVFED